jgi:hypothetical protein
MRVMRIAALLPLFPHGAALAVNVEPRDWLALGAAPRWGIGPDALLYTAACLTLAAPLAGVALAAASRESGERLPHRNPGGVDALRLIRQLMIAVSLFAIVSGLLTWIWSLSRPDALWFVVTTHLTLTAVALALAAVGAVFGSWLRQPLDAAACSLTLAVAAAVGLLVAGAPVARIPRPVVEWGLTASPFVALTSAAHVDIFRMGLLYQISPLAHLRIDYPEWYVAAAWHLSLALVCLVIMSLRPAGRFDPSV